MTGVAVFPGPDSVAHEEMHKAGRAATPGCGFDQDGGKSEIDSFCNNPEQRTSLVATSSGIYNDIKCLAFLARNWRGDALSHGRDSRKDEGRAVKPPCHGKGYVLRNGQIIF